MKAPSKAILGIVLIVCLPVVVWSGTLLYWHFKITGAVWALENGPRVDYGPALKTLDAAGCRAIPYLLRELEFSRDTSWLDWILAHLTAAKGMTRDKSIAVLMVVKECNFSSKDSTEERRRKVERITVLWEEHRPRHDPWWYVWPSSCGRR